MSCVWSILATSPTTSDFSTFDPVVLPCCFSSYPSLKRSCFVSQFCLLISMEFFKAGTVLFVTAGCLLLRIAPGIRSGFSQRLLNELQNRSFTLSGLLLFYELQRMTFVYCNHISAGRRMNRYREANDSYPFLRLAKYVVIAVILGNSSRPGLHE